jgi:hypothetical protein
MLAFAIITAVFTIGLFAAQAFGRRGEIMANWTKYRSNPIYAFTAFLYKPDSDTRSRLQFTSDNFNDVLTTMLTDTFKIFLDPVFKVFHLFMSTVTQSLGSLLSMKSVFGTMWRDFMKIIDVFNRRFALTFYELRKTYNRLFDSMKRTVAITTGAVFQGISAVNSIMSMIDLLIKICIIILVILVVLVIFFWFALWPFIPLILIVVGIATAAGFGAAVGGMAGSFCFDEHAQVVKADGSTVSISEVKIGDKLQGGATVTAVMEFEAATESGPTGYYNLDGVLVSGIHILYTDNGPTHVKDCTQAAPAAIPVGNRIFCLNTSTHRIPVMTSCGTVLNFSDWEELSDDDPTSLLKWDKFVFETLNPGETWSAPNLSTLHSEPVLHESAEVQTPSGSVCIGNLRPGDFVCDENGVSTRVTGIVYMDPNCVSQTFSGSGSFRGSAGLWIKVPAETDGWHHEKQSDGISSGEKPWISLFTEAGTFRLVGGQCVRDFTDIGVDRIENTYEWVLEALARSGK